MKKTFKEAYEKNMKETVVELNQVYSKWLKKWDVVITEALLEAAKETEKYAQKRQARRRK